MVVLIWNKIAPFEQSNWSLSLSLYVEIVNIVRVHIGQKIALTILMCVDVVGNISHLSSSHLKLFSPSIILLPLDLCLDTSSFQDVYS